MQRYVLGFLFNQVLDGVLFIEKVRPSWQKGFLNGIGGHIEDGEESLDAMRREFKEECGLEIIDWRYFCTLGDARGWEIDFYFSWGNLAEAQSTTDERVVQLSVDDVCCGKYATIPNIPWLIRMALSFYHGERCKSFFITEKN